MRLHYVTMRTKHRPREVVMKGKKIVSSIVMAGCLGIPALASLAQQPPAPSPGPSATTEGKGTTIDCPPAAAAKTPGGQIGNPSGSGLNAMPSVSSLRRVEGPIRSIGSTRTNRIVEVGDVKLEVEPTTVVLVGCRPASMADLKVGSRVKAAYQVKEPNRQLATVIEATN
jgi:hypothetical protein